MNTTQFTQHDLVQPNTKFPHDVTSPGPDQCPSTIRAQSSSRPTPKKPSYIPPTPDNADKPEEPLAQE